MSTYRIEDELVAAGDPKLNDALATVYATKVRPLCMCRKDGIGMYVAKIAGHFVLKRMPNTGGDHTASCDSYEPPPELSGLGQVMGSAIQENTDDGMTTLKLNFSLSKVAGRAAPAPSGTEKDSVKTDGNKLTLRGTLHYLWEEAGFNRWAPSMLGKRNWFVIRKFLLQAAENKMAKGAGLAELLYIPESYSVDKKEEIAQRRLARLLKASAPEKGARRLILMIGEVKEISQSRYGFKIKYKQVPDCDFMMNEDIHKRLTKRFETELGLWDAVEIAHLVAISTVSVGNTGVPSIEEVALMVVSDNWIPFENTSDMMLLDAMVSGSRRFQKGLRYNLGTTSPLACAVLSDTAPEPTGMYILPFGSSEDFHGALQGLMEQSRLPTWLWNAGQADMPSLPVQDGSRSIN